MWPLWTNIFLDFWFHGMPPKFLNDKTNSWITIRGFLIMRTESTAVTSVSWPFSRSGPVPLIRASQLYLGAFGHPVKVVSFFDSTTLLFYGLSKIHVHHQTVSIYNILHHNTFDGSIPSHQARWAHATHATRENETPCAAPPSRQRTRPWRKRGASQDALCSLLGSVVSIPNMNMNV